MVPTLACVHAAKLALLACGLRDGIVVDVGFSSTRVVPVLNGIPLRWASRSSVIGGEPRDPCGGSDLKLVR